MPQKVFVSYAQAPEEHKQRVAELVASLRAAGLSVLFDQDVTSPQGPPEGWPQWMLNQLDQADWVLVVCNETYYRRFRGREEPGRGLGARWEGAIIGQTLYNDGMLNRKFIPVLLSDGETTAHIPEPLRGATYYRVPAELPKLTGALSRETPAEPTASSSPATAPYRNRARSAGWLGALGALVLVGFLLWNFDLLAKLGLTRPSPTNFPLTVYVHGQAGPQDLILRSRGAVLLDLGSERRREPIGEKGQAFFPEIPASFRGQTVNVGLDAEGYELANSTSKLRLDSTSLYLPIRRKPGHLKGRVQDEQGDPIVGATVTAMGLSVPTDPSGLFDLVIPGDRVQNDLDLEVAAEGYTTWRYPVTLNSNEVGVKLIRRR